MCHVKRTDPSFPLGLAHAPLMWIVHQSAAAVIQVESERVGEARRGEGGGVGAPSATHPGWMRSSLATSGRTMSRSHVHVWKWLEEIRAGVPRWTTSICSSAGSYSVHHGAGTSQRAVSKYKMFSSLGIPSFWTWDLQRDSGLFVSDMVLCRRTRTPLLCHHYAFCPSGWTSREYFENYNSRWMNFF